MCRSIKPLYNFDPPVSNDEVRAAALQFIRKVSGFTKPSKLNEETFNRSVDDVAEIIQNLLDSLTTSAIPRKREQSVNAVRSQNH